MQERTQENMKMRLQMGMDAVTAVFGLLNGWGDRLLVNTLHPKIQDLANRVHALESRAAPLSTFKSKVLEWTDERFTRLQDRIVEVEGEASTGRNRHYKLVNRVEGLETTHRESWERGMEAFIEFTLRAGPNPTTGPGMEGGRAAAIINPLRRLGNRVTAADEAHGRLVAQVEELQKAVNEVQRTLNVLLTVADGLAYRVNPAGIANVPNNESEDKPNG